MKPISQVTNASNAPDAYAHEHITRFTREGLAGRLRAEGYEILDCRYVGCCEMIFKARKPATLKL